jgi:tRNA(fMet)-specific endonuclease VapC
MSLYIFDTDHLSLHQRNPQLFIQRLRALDPILPAITVITAEEQLRGRLAKIRSANSVAPRLEAYRLLRATIFVLNKYTILEYDAAAEGRFELLQQQTLRVGTQDLRIAAIALANQGILLTRNTADFGQVFGLSFEDWTK